jgi:hypothetical protein
MEINKLSKRTALLLALIRLSGGSVNGATRMQKLALLLSKDLQESKIKIGTFDDWVAGDYGGRSTQVYQSIDELALNDMLSEREAKFQGNTMKIYELTSFGKDSAAYLERLFGMNWISIASTTKRYVKAQTQDLVALSYDRYPELTIHSKIKPEVNRRLLKNSSGLSEMYEEDIGPMPSLKEKRREKIRESLEDEQFFKRREYEMQKLPDVEARKRMAKLVGLTEVPKFDPTAISKLRGIVANKTPDEEFDSVELVRAVRGD